MSSLWLADRKARSTDYKDEIVQEAEETNDRQSADLGKNRRMTSLGFSHMRFGVEMS